MTKEEARKLLYDVWGNHDSRLTTADRMTLGRIGLEGETLLDTVARLAGVDLQGVRPFDHYEIRRRLLDADENRTRERGEE